MNTEDLPFYNSRQWQKVKYFIERFPYLDVLLPLAFFVKPKKAIYACCLVIPTKQEHILWKFYLVTQ